MRVMQMSLQKATEIIGELRYTMPLAKLPLTKKSAKLREQAAALIAQAEQVETDALQEQRNDRAQRVILARLSAATERLDELTAATKERKRGRKELDKLQDRAAELQARADTAKTEWSAGLHSDADASALDVLQNAIVLAATQLHSVQLEIDAATGRLRELDLIIDGDDVDEYRAEVDELARIASDPVACMQAITDEAAEYRRGFDRSAPKQRDTEDMIMNRELGRDE